MWETTEEEHCIAEGDKGKKNELEANYRSSAANQSGRVWRENNLSRFDPICGRMKNKQLWIVRLGVNNVWLAMYI